MKDNELESIKEGFRNGLEAWKSFINNPCWKELADTMALRRVLHRDELEEGTGNEPDDVIKGRSLELKFILRLPERIVSELELERKESENGRDK